MERGPGLARPRRPLAALTFGLMVSSVLLLGGGEIIARVWGARPHESVPNEHVWAEEHPDLGWVNRAGSTPSHEWGHALMTFWADGRRASRPDSVAAEGQLRVVVLGGSHTMGYGVRDEETYSWLLDEALPDLAFDNYGTGAYGTYQSLLMLEQLLAAQAVAPDLVIYGFQPSHLIRNVQTFDWLEALRDLAGERFTPPHVLLRDGALDRHPPASLESWPLERESALVHSWHTRWYRWLLRDRHAQALPATNALLREMAELVRRSGSRLLVVILYDGGQPALLKRSGLMGPESSVNCTHPKDFRSPELRVGGTGHPNHRLHAFWAGCIESWIEANLRAD